MIGSVVEATLSSCDREQIQKEREQKRKEKKIAFALPKAMLTLSLLGNSTKSNIRSFNAPYDAAAKVKLQSNKNDSS
ncbi:hypothetical protein COP1_019558 [Malus domestica]